MSKIFPKVIKFSFYKYGPSGSVQNFDCLCILPLSYTTILIDTHAHTLPTLTNESYEHERFNGAIDVLSNTFLLTKNRGSTHGPVPTSQYQRPSTNGLAPTNVVRFFSSSAESLWVVPEWFQMFLKRTITFFVAIHAL